MRSADTRGDSSTGPHGTGHAHQRNALKSLLWGSKHDPLIQGSTLLRATAPAHDVPAVVRDTKALEAGHETCRPDTPFGHVMMRAYALLEDQQQQQQRHAGARRVTRPRNKSLHAKAPLAADGLHDPNGNSSIADSTGASRSCASPVNRSTVLGTRKSGNKESDAVRHMRSAYGALLDMGLDDAEAEWHQVARQVVLADGSPQAGPPPAVVETHVLAYAFQVSLCPLVVWRRRKVSVGKFSHRSVRRVNALMKSVGK
jgi:hypothetical protein